MLSAPVGRLHLRNDQEGEQRLTFPAQMRKQLAVGRIAGPSGQQPVERRAQPRGLLGGLGRVQLTGIAGVADRQGLAEDPADRVGGS